MERMPSSEPNEVPFKKKLVPSELRPTTLETFRGKKDVIVRTMPIEELRESLGNLDYETLIEEVRSATNDLSEKYGFQLPNTQYVIGKNTEGEEVLYGITEKIDGENLESLSQSASPEEARLIETWFLGVVEYLLDQFKSGNYYYWDTYKPEQYVYGTKEGETEKKIYLVDLDPHLAIYDKADPLGVESGQLFAAIEKTIGVLEVLEGRLGFELTASRSRLAEFIEKNIPVNASYFPDRKGLLAFLREARLTKPQKKAA